jgi:hypothetical protein
MAAQAGDPAFYLPPVSRSRPQFAQVGSQVVLGWDHTLIGLDGRTGRRLWTSSAAVAPTGYVTAISAAGPYAAVQSRPLHGGGAAYAYLLDPATGAVRARVPALPDEGIVWADVHSFVAVTPEAIVRLPVGGTRPVWSVALGKSARDGALTGQACGDVLVFGGWASPHPAYRLADGRAVPGLPKTADLVGECVGPYLVRAHSVLDVRSGRTVWTGAGDLRLARVDRQAGVAYFSHQSGGDARLVAVRLATGKSSRSALVGGESLDGVYDGVGVYSSEPSGELSVQTYFIGRDARSGRAVWSTYSLPNLYFAPSPDAPDQRSFVGGYTCEATDLVLRRSTAPKEWTCRDLRFTVINV